jgi:hypothetical protein
VLLRYDMMLYSFRLRFLQRFHNFRWFGWPLRQHLWMLLQFCSLYRVLIAAVGFSVGASHMLWMEVDNSIT